ncbi:MAG: NAD-dependent epimerase/dehydratase family protein [Chitinophagales bacterium]|nr:NAD-dependent epimerase/dehydratase family protein [Chitinophagales bacterium]MDW8427470.1 NAD-dependent epimerase/dehydratase family protein [Chitinophagales bacterium]
MQPEAVLVIGASGQIGTELTIELRKYYRTVVAADLKMPISEVAEGGPFVRLDVLNRSGLADCIRKYQIQQIYHLAAILSATGEKNPELAWRVNMKGLRNVLDCSVTLGVKKLFWPSTIAVFGPNSPKKHTPQWTIMEPNTIYGISKLAGERWCDYYYQKKNLDVRSLRYPGLISYKAPGGGGTTDYAIDIFFAAKRQRRYTCFLKADTRLPMMYMADAIRATLMLMEAPAERITVRSAYNIAAVDFTPEEVAAAIRDHIPDFVIDFEPDFRQQIAESWPESIDDSIARRDWGWKPLFDLKALTTDMLAHISV